MSMFFNGLTGYFDHHTPTPKTQKTTPPRVFPGHVLEICMNTTSNLFKSQKDIGKIRFRNLIIDTGRPDALCTSVAMPLDRSIARYPYPGEEVLIFRAVGDLETLIGSSIQDIYFYSFVVSTVHNVTANTHPFLGVDYKQVDPNQLFPSKVKEEIRLNNKITNLPMLKGVIANGDLIIRKQLQPHEGDFILQGRFGNTIRMAGTSKPAGTSWSTSNAGQPGDGIMILRVDAGTITTKMEDMLVEENIDTDDASIYMCTTQKVPFTLSCTKNMHSWIPKAAGETNLIEANSVSSTISSTNDGYEPKWKKEPTVAGEVSFKID